MSTNYFDFLEQNSSDNPASSTPRNNNEGMVNLTTRADAECQVVCDGDFLFLLPPNQIIKEKAPVGQHILQFISTEYPDVVVEKVVDFPEAGKNYLEIVSEFKTLIAEKEKLVAKPEIPAETIATIDFTAKLGGKGSYTGQVKDGVPEGRGKVVFASGSEYEGEFHNGWRHGKGVISFANGEKYEGDFVDDMRTGHGIYTYVNGNKLEGEFLEGNIQNKPNIFSWANGDKLECEGWDNGSTGNGVYYWVNGKKEEQLWDKGKRVQDAKVAIVLAWNVDYQSFEIVDAYYDDNVVEEALPYDSYGCEAEIKKCIVPSNWKSFYIVFTINSYEDFCLLYCSNDYNKAIDKWKSSAQGKYNYAGRVFDPSNMDDVCHFSDPEGRDFPDRATWKHHYLLKVTLK